MTDNVTVFAIAGVAASRDEAIKICAAALQERGIVTAQFAQDCIDREATFPTGILSEVPVAIPHCRSEAIVGNGLCYLRLESPVEFGRMDDDTETVKLRSIFNFAIGSGDHLGFLSRTMKLVADEELMSRLESVAIHEAEALLRAAISDQG